MHRLRLHLRPRGRRPGPRLSGRHPLRGPAGLVGLPAVRRPEGPVRQAGLTPAGAVAAVNVVIVGNGLAGTLAAKTVRELDDGAKIEILGEERHPYYPRPNLIEYLAGRLPYDKLFAFPAEWSERQRIAIRLAERVTRILPAERKIETVAGGER